MEPETLDFLPGDITLGDEEVAPEPNRHTTVVNSDSSVVYSGSGPAAPPAPAPIQYAVTNLESNMVPAGAPVYNSDSAVIYGPTTPLPVESWPPTAVAVVPPGGQVQPHRSVSNEGATFAAHNGTVSNDRDAAVILGPMMGVIDGGTPGPTHQSVRNEQVAFTPTPHGAIGNDRDAGVILGDGGVGGVPVRVDHGGVVMTGTGPTAEINGDSFIGGGGDLTKQVGEENFSFLGMDSMSVGGTEVQSAPSGDQTKTIGQDDVVMAANADLFANNEPIFGSQGVPVSNQDYNDAKQGAVGAPIKRNVT